MGDRVLARWPVVAALLVALTARDAGSAGQTGVVEVSVDLSVSGRAKGDGSGVVLYLLGFEEPAPDRVVEMLQRNKQFQPAVLPITAGQRVSFPNGDPFFHNVFSLSPTRKFDLGQFKAGETKVKTFPSLGVVEVFCNIHPDMAATILVLPNRRFAVTGHDGKARIDGVPPGTWTLYGYDRRAGSPVHAEVTVRAGQVTRARFSLDETRASFEHKNKYGEKYREPGRYP
jgi:plastocyanin